MAANAKEQSWYEGDILTSYWERFVDCEERTKSMMPFFKSALPSDIDTVIDLGAGIGCEAATLLQLGFEVTANEIDSSFRRIAVDRLGNQSKEVNWIAADWRDLSHYFASNHFDASLLLGNSFSVLLEEQDKKASADQFKSISAEGSRLIIDQRNFDYILNQKNQILSHGFDYSGDVVYCGEDVVGRPCHISKELVRFEYILRDEEKTVGHIDMYPFEGRELVDLFEDVGFTYKCTYFDLRDKQIYENKPEGHDFETHVFENTL